MAKPSDTACAGIEVFDHSKLRMCNWHENQLRDAFPRSDGIRSISAIPARNHQRPLIIRIDETDEISEHESIFVTQSRSGE